MTPTPDAAASVADLTVAEIVALYGVDEGRAGEVLEAARQARDAARQARSITVTAPAPANPVSAPPSRLTSMLPAEAWTWLQQNGWRVSLLDSARFRGRARYGAGGSVKLIEINVGYPGADHALRHETGHAIEYTVMSWAQRYEWLRLRGIAQWRPSAVFSGPDWQYGTGDFAEAVAAVLADPVNGQPILTAPLTQAQRDFVLSVIPFSVIR